MTGPTSPLRLPIDTIRLAVRFALPLNLLFAAGQLVRYLLIVAGIEVSPGRYQTVRDVVAALTGCLSMAGSGCGAEKQLAVLVVQADGAEAA